MDLDIFINIGLVVGFAVMLFSFIIANAISFCQ